MELLVIIITLALIFDYINGFHDAANSIATIVSTKVLTPFQAVIWAAFFNFVAFFIAKCIIGGFGIANTVSKTVVEQYISLPIILSGVIAAIVWNLFTWWKGIPSSSSHTLIGGFAGAAIMAHGFDAIQLNIILKIAAFIFLAPFIGMVVAFGFTLLVLHICRRAHPHTAEMWFKKLQLVSSALFSIGHGLNDSQKVMGIIAAAMIDNPPKSSTITSTSFLNISSILSVKTSACFLCSCFLTSLTSIPSILISLLSLLLSIISTNPLATVPYPNIPIFIFLPPTSNFL